MAREKDKKVRINLQVSAELTPALIEAM